MPLSREQKEQLVDDYQNNLAKAPHVLLLDYKGVTVNQDTELRRRIRDAGGTYAVVKNRLVLRVIDGQPLESLKDRLEGPTAAAFCQEDPVGLAKAVTDFAKDVPAIEIKGGLVEGQLVEAEEVKQIAALPSRDELVTKLVFLLQSPITGLVNTLAALPRGFVAALEQIRQQKEEAGS